MKSLFILLILVFSRLDASSIVVFGGEHEPTPEHWKKEIFTLGSYLGSINGDLITGGAKSGIMRAIVDGCISSNPSSQVRAIVRSAYREEPLHPAILQEHVDWLETRHECVEKFFSSSDTFLVLPGGLGTLYELIDSIIHNRNGQKTIILLNLENYWDPFIEQIQDIADIHPRAASCLQSLSIANSVQECIALLEKKNSKSTATMAFINGASRSGKSTVCEQINKSKDFCALGNLYIPFLLKVLSTQFPKEFSILQAGLEENNMRHAITRDLFIFKRDVPKELEAECKKAAEQIRQAFSTPEAYAAHKEEFGLFFLKQLQERSAVYPYILAESWYLVQENLIPLFPNTHFVKVLLYSPLTITLQRLFAQNNASLAKGDVMNYRFLADVFLSFFSFYELSSNSEGSIDVWHRSEILSLLDSLTPLLSDQSSGIDSPFLMQELSYQDLEKYRTLFLEKFNGEEKLYIVPKSHYDLILHTKDLTPEEAAEQITSFVRTHNPKIE